MEVWWEYPEDIIAKNLEKTIYEVIFGNLEELIAKKPRQAINRNLMERK